VVDVGVTWTLVVWLLVDVGAGAGFAWVTVVLCPGCVTVVVSFWVTVFCGCVVVLLVVVLFASPAVVLSLLSAWDAAVEAAWPACRAAVPDPPDPHELTTHASTAPTIRATANLAAGTRATALTDRFP
jgi:hypothetical protein